MTERAQRTERKSTRTVTGVTITGISLAGLMAFGTWLANTIQETRETQRANVSVDRVERYVTEQRWVQDSTRRDEQFRTLINELRDSRIETSQRLREICNAVRAGCR